MMSREVMMEKFYDRYEKWDERNDDETRCLACMAEELGLDLPELRIDKSNERVVKVMFEDDGGFESDNEDEYIVPEHVNEEIDEWLCEDADDEEEEDYVEAGDDRNLMIRMIWMMYEIAMFK